jgi:hypothetical protein
MTAARWSSEHSPVCWIEHSECALRATLSLLQARIAHDQGRTTLYRSAMNLGPGTEAYAEAVHLARAELTESHQARRMRERR